MKNLHRGFIIGSDVSRAPQGLNAEDFVNPPGFVGWVLGHGMSEAPPIASLLMRTATVSVDQQIGRDLTDVLILPDIPTVDLRDWEDYDVAVEAGYQATKKALSAARGPIARILRSHQPKVQT